MSKGRTRQSRLMPRWLQLPRQKMSRDCFIAPRAARWSTGLSPLIIMITRWAMGRVQREAGKGMKKTWIHPLVRSQPVLSTNLPGPSVGSCPSLYPDEVRSVRVDDRGDEIQFFPFIDPPQAYPCLEREIAHAMRHMLSLAVRVYANFVGALCLRAAPYSPPLTTSSTKDPGQTFIRLGIFIFRSSETTKRVTPYRRKGDGT